MKLGFKKDTLKNTLFLLGTCLCVFMAFVGFCVDPVVLTGGGFSSNGSDFGDLFKGGNDVSAAGFAFAFLGFMMLLAILVFMVFEIHNKYPQLTKLRMFLSCAAVVFFIISFGCVAGFAASLSGEGMKGIPGEGAFFHFFFGIGAAVVSLWFNRGIKFWETKKE